MTQVIVNLFQVTYDPEARPGVSNLVSMHAAATGVSEADVVAEAHDLDMAAYKARVAEALVEHLRPLRERINYYMENKDHLESVFGAGEETAREIAQETMDQAKKAIGLI